MCLLVTSILSHGVNIFSTGGFYSLIPPYITIWPIIISVCVIIYTLKNTKYMPYGLYLSFGRRSKAEGVSILCGKWPIIDA